MTSDDDHGRPDYHDPTAGLGGAAPAQSALTLRLILAVFGVVVCAAAAVMLSVSGGNVIEVAALVLLGLVAVGDFVVVLRRKRRGEPG
ncbi:MAG TPA: DUF6343 family protein [Actinomycetes bacterium]